MNDERSAPTSEFGEKLAQFAPKSNPQRPSTAPHSPTNTAPDAHVRSHSRLAASIKSFLSRSTLASPSRFSLNSSFSYSETDSSPFHPPPRCPPRKSRPPNLDFSQSALPSPTRSPNTPIIDLHRRYASDAVAKIYSATSGAPPMSQDSLALSSREREPKTRNVLRRRPSASAKLVKARERGMSSPTRRVPDRFDDATLVPLTPAGAVAEAYKLRDYPPKLFIDDGLSPRTSHGSGYEPEHLVHSPSSYHSPLRSSAERRMQAASDHRLPMDRLARSPIALHHSSPSVSSTRSLTRRVSTKWRKIKGGAISEESPARDRGHSKASSSLQVCGNDKPVTRLTGQSMDAVLNTAWPSPIEPHSRPGSEKAGSQGGKLWRLMRRISTGGLRDQFQTEKAVPPVPAIPKDILDKANHGERSNELVSTLPHPPSSPRDKDHTSPTPQNITSAAVTSSSSNSSDVASIRFFHKTHSARSSVSSYGEAVQSKDISLDRHIIAPVEQLRLGENHAEGDKPEPRPPRRSASFPATLRKGEDDEDEYGPLPSPRRQATFGGSPSPACSRPPSMTVSGPGCAHVSRLSSGQQSQTADGLVSLPPPPRPTRNTRRGGGSISSPSQSLSVKEMGPRQLDRTLSGQSDTTARASPEPGTSHTQDTRTQYTYRELGARRPPLSEREKLEIWNDLLDRSDRAGGTLHMGGAAELLSDNLRFSMHSEV